MMRYTFTAMALALCWSMSTCLASTSGSDLSPAVPPAQADGSNSRADIDLSDLVRSAPVSLRKAIGIAERQHRHSRTAAIKAELAADGLVYKVKTVGRREVREIMISTRSGAILNTRELSSAADAGSDHEVEFAALRRVGPDMVDALLVAERSTGGTAVEGGLRTEDGRLKFVITVLAGDDLKNVILEPPGALLRDPNPLPRPQPARSPARTGGSADGTAS